MSSIASAILGPMLVKTAIDVGAPLVRQIVERAIGKESTDLLNDIVNSIAGHAGATPDELPDLIKNDPQAVEIAMLEVEAESPEKIALYMSGLAGQAALAAAENKKGGMASSWRWGWMYLLGFFWLWTIILVPLVNAIAKSTIETVELGILLTLTSWFIALYMGGHTVKELGKNALDAIKAMREN